MKSNRKQFTLFLMFLMCCLALIILAGCDIEKEEYAVSQFESAVVKQAVVIPAEHRHSDTMSMDWTGDGGLSTHNTDTTIAAKYMVVFECSHGQFAIEGPDRKSLWEKCPVGAVMKVEFQEVFLVDGQGGRRFKKMHFVDATRVIAPEKQ